MTKITKAGVYDISFEEYHSNPVADGHSVSGSGLIEIEQTCLALYHFNSYHNPDRPSDDDTPAKQFGRVFHTLALEGETAFAARYFVKPRDMNFATKEGKAWKLDHAGREIIPEEWADRAAAMVAAIKAHPLCGRVFRHGHPERSILWKDAETGIWCKTRPDFLPQIGETIANLKSTMSLHPARWEKQAIDLGYHQSSALLEDGLREVCGWRRPVGYFLVQEKTAPYLTAPVVIDDDVISWGRRLNRRSLRRLADSLSTGRWPSYTDGVLTVRMPKWAESQLEARFANGEFPDIAQQGSIT